MRFTVLLCGFFILSGTIRSKAQAPSDTARLSDQRSTRIEKEGIRGIRLPGNIVAVVEDDLRTIALYQDERLRWRTDLPEALNPRHEHMWVVEPLILSIAYEETYLNVTFAKHCWAHVQLADGAAELQGCD